MTMSKRLLKLGFVRQETINMQLSCSVSIGNWFIHIKESNQNRVKGKKQILCTLFISGRFVIDIGYDPLAN